MSQFFFENQPPFQKKHLRKSVSDVQKIFFSQKSLLQMRFRQTFELLATNIAKKTEFNQVSSLVSQLLFNEEALNKLLNSERNMTRLRLLWGHMLNIIHSLSDDNIINSKLTTFVLICEKHFFSETLI